MKKVVFFLVFIASFQLLTATTREELDSVQQVLSTTTDVNTKLICLYTLSYENGLINPQRGIEYGYECLNLAVQVKDTFFQLNAYNGIANAYETLARYDSALFFHRKSYEIAKLMDKPQTMALTISNLALCYKQMGNYKNSLNQHLAAYKILCQEKSYNPRIHFYLGEIYIRLENYSEAYHHSQLGIIKSKEFNLDYVGYNLYVNLAKCYQYYGKLDSAEHLLNYALDGLIKNTDKTSIGICLKTLGENYLKKKEYFSAYQTFEEENAIHNELNNESGKCLSFLSMAHSLSFVLNSNIKNVEELLLKSEELVPKIKGNNDMLFEVYNKLAESYENIGNQKKALDFHKLLFNLNDKILNKEKVFQLQELQEKYESEKKESRIKLLQKSNEFNQIKIKSKNTIIILIVSLVVLILSFFYFYLKQTKTNNLLEKEQTIRATEEKERLRIAKDIHDDLGSGLSKISFLSEIVTNKCKEDKSLTEACVGITETSSYLIDNMKDLIWALNPKNTTLANLVARIREYSSDYIDGLGIELTLNFPENISNTPISKDFHHEIFMVVKECLNNIVKHAQASAIFIFLTIEYNQFQLLISDNGIGMNLHTIKNGNGLNNIRNRMAVISGKAEIESSAINGTKINLTAPINRNLY